MLSRVAIGDSGTNPMAAREISLFYSNLFHAMKKPYDFTGHVPSSWTGVILSCPLPSALSKRLLQPTEGCMASVDGKADSGYVFDLATMWDQYKCLLPLIVSVWPDGPGQHLCDGLLALAKRFGDFPCGYTMDAEVTRFAGQAIGLAHHTLGDG